MEPPQSSRKPSGSKLHLLVLGGSSEAMALARALAGRTDVEPILSLAGRTSSPVTPPIPYRVGGFGGIDGLKEFLMAQHVDLVIDATHPFAAQMSAHAVSACGALGVPLAVFTRPAWRPGPGDNWIAVESMAEASRALGAASRRIFLTVGGLQLAAFAAAPHHHYLVRTIEPPEALASLPDHRLVLARGPFKVEDEIALMRDERIDVLVTKNSGGQATEGKLEAARALGLPVIMIERPKAGSVPTFERLDDVLAWIESHRPAP
jgi:precorrin-6A/cobalt-precorrin-6A reductase